MKTGRRGEGGGKEEEKRSKEGISCRGLDDSRY